MTTWLHLFLSASHQAILSSAMQTTAGIASPPWREEDRQPRSAKPKVESVDALLQYATRAHPQSRMVN